MGCRCGGGRSTAPSSQQSRGEPRGPVRFRVIPPVGDPVDNIATFEEASAVQDRIGGEVKRVIGS